MLMLDICSGLQGASAAMRERGWQVITLDINPAFRADIVADVRFWSWTGQKPDLIWCSPPCTEFARESMPWCKTGKEPDLSIVNACKRIVAECKPRYWILENVRGAVRWLGKPSAIIGPFYLWGVFPDIGLIQLHNFRKKETYSSKQAQLRSKIPHELSLAIAIAIENQATLFDADLLAGR